MISDTASIERWMEELSSEVGRHIDLYMIGGGAMMYMGRKVFTKDVDCVVRTREEYDEVRGALLHTGFEAKIPGAEYRRMNVSNIYENPDGRRMDLFETKVCGKLRLTDGMASRSVVRLETENVTLRTCSAEDVLIFKAITERPGDLEDSARIVETRIVDWDAVLEEINTQVDMGEDVWITWIATGLSALAEERGVDIPILDEVIRMADEFLEKWERDLIERSGMDPRDV